VPGPTIRKLRRMRRPLVALLILVAALGIGYGVRAARDDAPHPAPTMTTTVPTMQHT